MTPTASLSKKPLKNPWWTQREALKTNSLLSHQTTPKKSVTNFLVSSKNTPPSMLKSSSPSFHFMKRNNMSSADKFFLPWIEKALAWIFFRKYWSKKLRKNFLTIWESSMTGAKLLTFMSLFKTISSGICYWNRLWTSWTYGSILKWRRVFTRRSTNWRKRW